MGFHLSVSADQGQITNPRFLEIPIQGPKPANLLVTLTGVAIVVPDDEAWDQLNDGYSGSTTAGDIYIETNYKLRDSDELVDQATWVSLASIDADDDPDFIIAINSAETLERTSNVIQVHVAALTNDDASILRISYQSNILVNRTQ